MLRLEISRHYRQGVYEPRSKSKKTYLYSIGRKGKSWSRKMFRMWPGLPNGIT